MHPGLKVATAYSLPSYQLGFCGPQEVRSKELLLDFANGKRVDLEKVEEALRQFEAPYPYFKLIAKSNGLDDPFAEEVVKAMWVGNSLLENVRAQDLRKLVTTDFVRPGLLSLNEAQERARKIPDGAVPHHSFHVLILGPVAGRVDLKGPLLDLCRVGWGRVVEIKTKKSKVENLKIKCRPLILGKKMKLGAETEKEISWNKKIVPQVKVGDWVSFHWSEVGEVLTAEDVVNLEYYTKKTIDLVNGQSK
ncbi:MAG: hypothetical protein A2Z42_01025 [Candidatus Woykebacteria bacterium RBG_19FT_COMBO_43_10]|uniref:Uncharacterized protein n=1 Tax=Candidatus Woykebacteria bacterium RBG_19FT_COMBO_43_10 TaxID=1802598 RepID=A0A1G1WL10_9BACT|nr:MAG: hypothetical protein A2Z42_01025 [Candidatus Woykebacteria bacterium RBG_19FT_COMBO_43_10]